MKTLVVYYSLSGNCRVVADVLKSSLGAEVLEIKTLKNKKRTKVGKFLWGLSLIARKKRPALKPHTVNINDFGLIILGTPVWAWSPSLVMLSFLEKTKISGKKIALFCCHGGGMGKAMEEFKAKLSGNTIVGEIDFANPAHAGGAELNQKIDEWAKTLKT